MTSSSTITLSMPQPDIAQLVFDSPGKGANILSRSVLDELSRHLDELQKRKDLAGLIISSNKPNMFIAGADINEFVASRDAPRSEVVAICQSGQALFGRLTDCPFVTVAAIDGVCLGGGAELALHCDRRIFSDSPKSEIGFPEVKLGLFPGWGGTVRTPRMVGLANAIEMITAGESVRGMNAVNMGLVSEVAPAGQLLDEAVSMIRQEQRSGDYLRDRQQWSQPVTMDAMEVGFLGATASALIQDQTKGQYPAPMAALELVMESAGDDVQTALKKEAEGLANLFGSPVNVALLNVFQLNDRIKKDRGVQREDIRPGEIRSVAVIGAGIMGCGIAAANVKREIRVVLTDAAADALELGAQSVLEEVSYDRATKSASVSRAVRFGALLNISPPPSSDPEVAGCDLVIEAVVESPAVKKHIFARLEPQLSETAILASNTSTLPITDLALNLQRPDRFCGIHFFNPVRRMQLVEVIRGQRTSDETIATAVAYAKQIGKLPIVVRDGPGFLVNRLLFPYMNESVELLCEGAEIKAIERAAKRFGMPMGPIELFDMVGLDTAVYAGRTMIEAFPDRFVASPVTPALVKAGRLGRKSGAGFFTYDNRKRRPELDPQLEPIIGTYFREEKREFTQEQLTDRLFLPMLLEATRALQAQIVRDVRDVDFGLIFGLGFPPFRGGLLHWADTLGAKKILEMLKPLEELGQRMVPTELLQEMARDGKRFYG